MYVSPQTTDDVRSTFLFSPKPSLTHCSVEGGCSLLPSLLLSYLLDSSSPFTFLSLYQPVLTTQLTHYTITLTHSSPWNPTSCKCFIKLHFPNKWVTFPKRNSSGSKASLLRVYFLIQHPQNGPSVIFILKIRNLKVRVVDWFAQSHTAVKMAERRPELLSLFKRMYNNPLLYVEVRRVTDESRGRHVRGNLC